MSVLTVLLLALSQDFKVPDADLIYDTEIQAVGSWQLIIIPQYIWQQD